MFLQTENFLEPREMPAIAQITRQAKFIAGKLCNPRNVSKDNVIGDNSDPMACQASQVDRPDTKILASSRGCNAARVRMWSR
jgi:hypothetical protein